MFCLNVSKSTKETDGKGSPTHLTQVHVSKSYALMYTVHCTPIHGPPLCYIAPHVQCTDVADPVHECPSLSLVDPISGPLK